MTTSSQLRRGIAKLVKALDFDSSIPRFESLFPCHSFVSGPVEAQAVSGQVEQRWRRPSANHTLSSKYSATRFPLATFQKISSTISGTPNGFRKPDGFYRQR